MTRFRAVGVAAVALSLVVVGDPALAAKSPAHTTISAHLTATTVLVKTTASVVGTVSPAAGSVALQRLESGTWTTVAHATPNRSGVFAFSVRAPKSASSWSLKVVRAASRSAKAGSSGTLHLRAVTQQFLVLATSSTTVTAPAATVVSGLASPATKGPAQVQELRGKTWIAVGTGKVGAGGVFSVNAVLPAGVHHLRAVRPYTSGVASGFSATFTVTVAAASIPSVATAALPAARVGVPYAALLTASGGNGFYQWSATGLPTGITLSAAGLLAGTPAAPGSSSITVTVTDGAGKSANGNLTLSTAVPAGRLFGFGDNFYGELGNGTTADALTTVPVAGMTSVVAVSTGDSTTLAIKSDGTLWAWGHNNDGQLGIGNTGDSPLPVQVAGLSGVTAVVAAVQTSYALKADGTVWAWGYNVSGQVNSTQANQLSPVQVSGLTSIVAISSTQFTAYALRSDGTVWAWGYGHDGELGNGSTTIAQSTPVQVTGLSGIKQIASTGQDGYALRADGTVAAWGDNVDDELGTATPSSSLTPVTVPGVTQVTQIAGGMETAYALTSSGTVLGWGNNPFSDLGGATNSAKSGPVTIRAGAIAIGAGADTAFALLTDHTVSSWGYNAHGQLGNGTMATGATPAPVTGVSGVQSLGTTGSAASAFLIAS